MKELFWRMKMSYVEFGVAGVLYVEVVCLLVSDSHGRNEIFLIVLVHHAFFHHVEYVRIRSHVQTTAQRRNGFQDAYSEQDVQIRMSWLEHDKANEMRNS